MYYFGVPGVGRTPEVIKEPVTAEPAAWKWARMEICRIMKLSGPGPRELWERDLVME